jgi:hypothetical protein
MRFAADENFDNTILRGLQRKIMPGVFIVDDQMAIGKAIEELALVIGASIAEEWQNLVIFIPMS